MSVSGCDHKGYHADDDSSPLINKRLAYKGDNWSGRRGYSRPPPGIVTDEGGVLGATSGSSTERRLLSAPTFETPSPAAKRVKRQDSRSSSPQSQSLRKPPDGGDCLPEPRRSRRTRGTQSETLRDSEGPIVAQGSQYVGDMKIECKEEREDTDFVN
jgi:hypothetical protein